MAIYAPPNTATEFTSNFGVSGLVGTIGVSINDNLGNIVTPRTTAGITEFPPASGLYYVTLVTPVTEGQYSVVWDDTVDFGSDDLVITSSSAFAEVGLPGDDLGPCTSWIAGTDVATCCQVDYGTDPSVLDGVAQEASALLFELSGRRFPGICYDTVRPCRTMCGCPWQVLSRGHLVWNPNFLYDGYYGWWNCSGEACGCRPLSRVLLAGFVREVAAVVIDGDTVDPATYRVDQNKWLTRVRDPADPDTALVWPGCQNLDEDAGEPGTWSVSYVYGHNPPSSGQSAAEQLACELWKRCNNDDSCRLPNGVTRVTRQGVVMDLDGFRGWGFEVGKRGRFKKGWNTGLAAVDAFLSAYNPAGLKRAPVFWSPASIGRYSQSFG